MYVHICTLAHTNLSGLYPGCRGLADGAVGVLNETVGSECPSFMTAFTVVVVRLLRWP